WRRSVHITRSAPPPTSELIKNKTRLRCVTKCPPAGSLRVLRALQQKCNTCRAHKSARILLTGTANEVEPSSTLAIRADAKRVERKNVQKECACGWVERT